MITTICREADVLQVKLTWPEMAIGAHVGMQRQLHALKDGRPNRHGLKDNAREEWGKHIEGACGELAFAKRLGLYWEPKVNTFREGGDVGQLQVRTRSRPHYDLPIRPEDKDAAAFVLLTGRAPCFVIRGWWLVAGEAKKHQEWWQVYGGRPGAWFVPQMELEPISSLLERLDEFR